MSQETTAVGGAGVTRLNELKVVPARQLLENCCGSKKWVAAMLAERPFASVIGLKSSAREAFNRLTDADWKEAFKRHPRIGDIASLKAKFAGTAGWASGEQAGAASASEEIFKALNEGNEAYFKKHGFIFIICATGKSAAEMLAALNARMPNDTEKELRIAAGEQTKITDLRLDKLLSDLLLA
jgi:2-oxo-4-hydroxy-4-carboxy-5-ureidoimidazoline decarboxylase